MVLESVKQAAGQWDYQHLCSCEPAVVQRGFAEEYAHDMNAMGFTNHVLIRPSPEPQDGVSDYQGGGNHM